MKRQSSNEAAGIEEVKQPEERAIARKCEESRATRAWRLWCCSTRVICPKPRDGSGGGISLKSTPWRRSPPGCLESSHSRLFPPMIPRILQPEGVIPLAAMA